MAERPMVSQCTTRGPRDSFAIESEEETADGESDIAYSWDWRSVNTAAKLLIRMAIPTRDISSELSPLSTTACFAIHRL